MQGRQLGSAAVCDDSKSLARANISKLSVGISTNTLLNWQKVPEFQAAYRDARRSVYNQAMARMQQALPLAVQTMVKVLVDPATPASVRVRAAEVIANHSHKAIEIEDVEARVAALEEAAGDLGKR